MDRWERRNFAGAERAKMVELRIAKYDSRAYTDEEYKDTSGGA
jgi:hypothetical protein